MGSQTIVRSKRAAARPAGRKPRAKDRLAREAGGRIHGSEIFAEMIADQIRRVDIKKVTPLQALTLLFKLRGEMELEDRQRGEGYAFAVRDRERAPAAEGDSQGTGEMEPTLRRKIEYDRLVEAGWIPVSERMPRLGEVIQDAEIGGGYRRCFPLADKFPPDDLSTVRRESEIVLVLIEEDKEPHLYQYIEYAGGRKIWDDYGTGSSPFDGELGPTLWLPLPGGAGQGSKGEFGPARR